MSYPAAGVGFSEAGPEESRHLPIGAQGTETLNSLSPAGHEGAQGVD